MTPLDIWLGSMLLRHVVPKPFAKGYLIYDGWLRGTQFGKWDGPYLLAGSVHATSICGFPWVANRSKLFQFAWGAESYGFAVEFSLCRPTETPDLLPGLEQVPPAAPPSFASTPPGRMTRWSVVALEDFNGIYGWLMSRLLLLVFYCLCSHWHFVGNGIK